MKQFNVLARDLRLHQHYLLEASAGTGKTFSIQNIVVRLLIESNENHDPFILNKILVVTFTRAATRDLKLRIRANIEQAIHCLEQKTENMPDYLQAIIEQGEEATLRARKRLQQALYTFDQAQIFTIHAFCARMLRQCALEGDMSFQATHLEDSLPASEILEVIRDFFRTEVRLELYSPAQLDILLKEDPDQRKLLRVIQRGIDLVPLPTYQQLYLRFVEAIQNIKKQEEVIAEQAWIDFNQQAPFYRNYKSGETKAETLIKIKKMTELFDQEDWTTQDFDELITYDLVWVKALDKKLLKNKPYTGFLHHPHLTETLEKQLLPIIETARNFSILLARIARDCQQLLRRYQREEEKLSPDDLLRKMEWALNQPTFCQQIQANYQAAIIDEFQDTDPLQWQIFRRLFISNQQEWNGYLYLVGDPKQSIYSFRQADIYTYLEAAQDLGDHHCFSLDVNYRSQPQLVNALNTIFAKEHLPLFIPLPKKNLNLAYQPVRASTHHLPWSDEKGAIHFFIADGQAFDKPKLMDLETKVFFPFIAQEIDRLMDQKQLNYRHFAILVRDRHQALRLATYFDHLQLPYVNQRGTSLADSLALRSLIDLIRAVLHPYDRGMLRTALGSPLMGWSYEELKNLDTLEFALILIQQLRYLLINKGFAPFFEHLLHQSCHLNGQTILEQLLAREGGLDFYHDIQQIADCVIDHHYREWNSPEGIIAFLDQFQQWEQDEDERVKRFQDPTKNGVKILTLHFSKGLEFEVVFALGLMNRTGIKEDLIPLETKGEILLTPISEACEAHAQFCEENDAEKMRQLYVALTRAKLQLYIPIALHLPSQYLKLGEASPIDLFLSRFGQSACSYTTLYERIKKETGQTFIQVLEEKGMDHGLTYSIHQSVNFKSLKKREKTLQEPLIIPPIIKRQVNPLIMTSFTSLSRQERQKNLERALNPPQDLNHSLKNIFTLPANAETGMIAHQLLERVPFQEFRSMTQFTQVTPFIHSNLQKTAFKEWEDVFSKLIFNTLKTPLKGLNERFCLADLPSHHYYREMPFLFPMHLDDPIEGLTFQNGLIKGVIDCVFKHKDFYYLVDWKSHWLGGTFESYKVSQLDEVMHAHHYFLQAAIYQKALERYLKLVEPRPFSECFGGTFYLFLRGLQPEQETGIYFMSGQTVN